MITRSACAFRFSAIKLERESKRLYMWTFTFVSVPISDAYAMGDWHMLHRRIIKIFPDLRGLRVCELHRSHGIHFHVLINRRIPIDRVKRLCWGNGNITGKNRRLDFGRIHVVKANLNAAQYMAKYLTKQYTTENNFRRRRWGSVGGFDSYKKNEIEIIDDFSKNKKRLFKKAKLNFKTVMLLKKYSNFYGLVKNWPNEYVRMLFIARFTGDNKTFNQIERETNEIVFARLLREIRFPKKTKFNKQYYAAHRAGWLAAGSANNSATTGIIGDASGEIWNRETVEQMENAGMLGIDCPF